LSFLLGQPNRSLKDVYPNLNRLVFRQLTGTNLRFAGIEDQLVDTGDAEGHGPAPFFYGQHRQLIGLEAGIVNGLGGIIDPEGLADILGEEPFGIVEMGEAELTMLEVEQVDQGFLGGGGIGHGYGLG
jgi:hypothetical protein